jgi:hypothetical protein
MPIRRTSTPEGIAACCARAARGHAAAAPPSSVMNSRRFMPNMGLPRHPVAPRTIPSSKMLLSPRRLVYAQRCRCGVSFTRVTGGKHTS